MPSIRYAKLEQLQESVEFVLRVFPNTEVKSVVCSFSRLKSVIKELKSRREKEFVAIVFVVWIVVKVGKRIVI